MINDIQIAALAELELRKRREEQKKNNEELKSFYQKNPLEYFNKRLGIPRETIDWNLNSEYKNHKWDGSENPLMQIINHLANNKWVGVESATGTGKTFLGALLVFWFLENFENSIVITTAPKREQLSLHIWKEIGKLFPKFGRGELTSLKIRMNANKEDWIAVGFIAGVKTDEESTTKAQGFHAKHLLIIFEETPGIPQAIITAFQNTCVSEHNLILALGNPDNERDNLHRFCLQENVEHIRISAYDHPNVVLKNPNFIPGAATEDGIKRIINHFGIDSPLALSRTRGLSPKQSNDSLIKLDWCMNAVERYNEYCNEEGIINLNKVPGFIGLGVDVANSEFGDKAAFAFGKGEICYSIQDFQCPDSNQLGHQIYILMKEQNINEKYLGIDGVGVGAGTINTLKEYGIKSKEINLQGAAQQVKTGQEEKFNNFRSQMWWQAREDLRLGTVGMVNDIDLIADLTTPKFEIKNGKIYVESKEEIKKRLGRSPNKGDAFVYWNWRRKERKNNKELKAVSSLY